MLLLIMIVSGCRVKSLRAGVWGDIIDSRYEAYAARLAHFRNLIVAGDARILVN
jgi:hypothetical protein